MILCLGCHSKTVQELMDVGLHPISNRFVKNRKQVEDKFTLALGQCQECGLVQLTQMMPAKHLCPSYDWITYNEPEGHLDSVVEQATQLSGINPSSVIGGISYKEDTVLQRFNQLGFEKTWRLKLYEDLGICQSSAGIESIQEKLSSDIIPNIHSKYELADVLVVRHLIEHSYEPIETLDTLKQLIKPEGYIIFEVPDCRKLMRSCDYSVIWEEHILYFTENSFQKFLTQNHFHIEDFTVYPYSHENSLVAIVKCDPPNLTSNVKNDSYELEHSLFKSFCNNFDFHKRRVQDYIKSFSVEKGKIAMFGAGHLACMFLNLMEIKNYIEFVVDDFPQKQGLYMPGSKLKIMSSRELLNQDIKLCLSTLSPESEIKVVNKQADFIQRGGQFLSIFPSNPISIQSNINK